jgi:glycosyltransferase involved in cell wall biosynthesis
MKLQPRYPSAYPEAQLHRLFGRWAAAQLRKEHWDVVHIWSGVAEEVLNALARTSALKIVMRGSAHIRTQARLLAQEEERTGVTQDHPSDWMIAREEREYALANRIVTLSSFAYNSFVAEGVASDKLFLLPLGANLQALRPRPEVVEARCQRILSGEPLRVLYVGSVSYQKGLQDMATIVRMLAGDNFHFRFVGGVTPEAKPVVAKLLDRAEFIGRRPQQELSNWYAKSDIFFFPTIQDGYAVVLAQANASSLPVLASTNCGGPDLLKEGRTGWLLPIRDASAFAGRLRWCDSHRAELAAMVRYIYHDYKGRDWQDVAADFETLCVSGRVSLAGSPVNG